MARSRRLIALAAWMVGVTLQTGSLMSSDAFARYNAAHSLWTSKPAVEPSTDIIGVVGRDGVLQAPFGVGQSLLMLPGDIIASAIVRIVGVPEPVRRQATIAIMCFLIFPLVTAGVALAGHELLRSTGAFTERTAFVGALTLLLATTAFPYSQVHQENNLILLQTLAAFAGVTRWALTRSRGALAIASVALGWMLLTRLPSVAATAPAAFLYALALARRARTASAGESGEGAAAPNTPMSDAERPGIAWWFIRDLTAIAAPVLALAVIGDRIYHVFRFGSEHLLGTYWGPKAEQWRALHPQVPVDWPFSGSFVEGLVGPLLDPQRSIFITEPLLLLLMVSLVVVGSRVDVRVRALLTALALSFVIYLVLHARLEFWSGAWSWGARYHTAPVAILAMLGVCIALAHGGRTLVLLRRVLVPVAVGWQLCAVAVDYSAEEVQSICGGRRPVFLVTARVSNIARIVSGRELPHDRPCGFTLAPEAHQLTFLPFRNATHFPPAYRPLVGVAWGSFAVVTVLLCAWLAVGPRRRQSSNSASASHPAIA